MTDTTQKNQSGKPKKILVLVTSLDGNFRNPFDHDAVVGDVHREAYDRIVKQKDLYPFERTWLEYNGSRIDTGTKLASLVGDVQGGPNPDLMFSLTWETGGGA